VELVLEKGVVSYKGIQSIIFFCIITCLTLVIAPVFAGDHLVRTRAITLPIDTVHQNIKPSYNPSWPHKVTNHTTDDHLACDVVAPQSSGCDYVINVDTYDGTIKIKPGRTDPAPGETVCILPGAYSGAEIFDVHGTQQQPITIRNCGGQAVINTRFKIRKTTHIRLLGDGDVNTLYGIKTTGDLFPSAGSGMSIETLSRDIEIAFNDISAEYSRGALHFNTGNPEVDDNGDYIPRYDLVTGEPFVQTKSHIHHNIIHSSLEGEGLYLGVAGCGEAELDAGTALEHTFVHDNIVVNNGADGIQVGCSREDTLIYNNYIYNSGYNPFNNLGHTKAIQLGAGTSGLVFNNYIEKAASSCIFLGGGPTNIEGRDLAVSIHNNIMIDCSEAVAVHSSVEDVVVSNQGLAVANNTIIDMRISHFWLTHHFDDLVQVDVKNNLYVDAITTVSHIVVNGEDNVGDNFQEDGSLFLSNMSQAQFIDPVNGDYNLEENSPARDFGVDAVDLDVVYDINANIRDPIMDAGAAEFIVDVIFTHGFE